MHKRNRPEIPWLDFILSYVKMNIDCLTAIFFCGQTIHFIKTEVLFPMNTVGGGYGIFP